MITVTLSLCGARLLPLDWVAFSIRLLSRHQLCIRAGGLSRSEAFILRLSSPSLPDRRVGLRGRVALRSWRHLGHPPNGKSLSQAKPDRRICVVVFSGLFFESYKPHGEHDMFRKPCRGRSSDVTSSLVSIPAQRCPEIVRLGGSQRQTPKLATFVHQVHCIAVSRSRKFTDRHC